MTLVLTFLFSTLKQGVYLIKPLQFSGSSKGATGATQASGGGNPPYIGPYNLFHFNIFLERGRGWGEDVFGHYHFLQVTTYKVEPIWMLNRPYLTDKAAILN